MTETAVAPLETDDAKRNLALLKAVGLDRAAPEQRELAIAIAARYGLDLMLKHLVLIDGKPYVTRDALLHIAHRSGQFDGIETTTPEVIGDEWRCTATVWRRDMSHPFTYGGRYPVKGRNANFAPEMAIKVAESMALRRAFNVAAPVVEERWDVDLPAEPVPPRLSLAERAAAGAAAAAARASTLTTEVTVLAEPMTEEASAARLAELQATDVERGALADALLRAEEASATLATAHETYVNVEEIAEGAPAVLRHREGLDLGEFAAEARKGHVLRGQLARAMGCETGAVDEKLKAMTDLERGVLADELNLDWRTA